MDHSTQEVYNRCLKVVPKNDQKNNALLKKGPTSQQILLQMEAQDPKTTQTKPIDYIGKNVLDSILPDCYPCMFSSNRQEAAGALWNLSFDDRNREAIAAAGGVEALV